MVKKLASVILILVMLITAVSAKAIETVSMSVMMTDDIVKSNNYTSYQMAKYGLLRAAITLLLCFDFSWDSHSKATLDDVAYMDTSYFAEKDGEITVLLRGRNYLDGYNIMIMYTPADGTAAYSLFSEKEDGSFAMLKAALAETKVTVYENENKDIIEIANSLGMNYYIEYEDETDIPSESSMEINNKPAAGKEYSSGLLSYRSNGKWGYIDSSGEVVIPFQWDYTGGFSEGYAMVFNGTLNKYEGPDKGQFGVINTAGEYVIPLTECAYISVYEPIENDITISYDGNSSNSWDRLYELRRLDGTKIGDGQWNDCYDPDGRNLICVSRNEKWGYIDRNTGETVIDYQYDKADYFMNGLACVGKRQSISRVSYEYIDENGNVIIKDKGWDVAYSFEEGSDIAKVFKGSTLYDGELADEGKYALIDRDGNLLCDYIWDSISICDNGLIIVSSEDNGKKQYGVIDRELNFIIRPSLDYISEYTHGLACVFIGSLSKYGSPENGSYSYVDEKGNMIADFKWSQASSYNADGYAVVGVTDSDGVEHYGIIDTAGNTVVKPVFDDIPGKGYISDLFVEGLAVAQVNGKYGYINRSGTFVFDAEWDKAEEFCEGKAVAWKEDDLYILSPDGTALKIKQ